MEIDQKTAEGQFSKAGLLFTRVGPNLQATSSEVSVIIDLNGDKVIGFRIQGALPPGAKLLGAIGALGVLIDGAEVGEDCQRAFKSGDGFNGQSYGSATVSLQIWSNEMSLIAR